MQAKGGYAVIDFENKNLSSVTSGYDKILAAILAAIDNNKTTLLQNLNVGGVTLEPVFACWQKGASGSYSWVSTMIPAIGYITINNLGVVTFKADSPTPMPSWPTANGTYYLKCVKSSTGYTFSWSTLPT